MSVNLEEQPHFQRIISSRSLLTVTKASW